MLSKYLEAALKLANYEILDENGEFYGEIAACQGVYATATSLEECRNELAEALEDWLLFRIHQHLELPVIDGLEISIKKESAA